MIRPAQLIASLFILLPIVLAPQGAQATASENGREISDICRELTRRAEQDRRIPARLLSAVSLAESGRWMEERAATVAWPWTVYAEGRGRYLPNKAAAIAEVRALQAKGVSNIDVGCMQVNLHHHGDAFASIEEALEPERNIAYAADFMVSLHGETRSWNTAVAHYHSRTPKYGSRYKKKVLGLWRDEQRRDYEERREEGKELIAERKAELEARREAGKDLIAERKAKLEERRRRLRGQLTRQAAKGDDARRAGAIAAWNAPLWSTRTSANGG